MATFRLVLKLFLAPSVSTWVKLARESITALASNPHPGPELRLDEWPREGMR